MISDRMCACKDMTCGENVWHEYNALFTELAGEYGHRASPDVAAMSRQAVEQLNAC